MRLVIISASWPIVHDGCRLAFSSSWPSRQVYAPAVEVPMSRAFFVSTAVATASSALLVAQAPQVRSPRTTEAMVLAQPEMSCRVLSESELEVRFRDQSTRRIAIPSSEPTRAIVDTRSRALAAEPLAVMSTPPSVPTPATGGITGDGQVTRGFDDNGQPYIEERLPDGTIRRIQQNGVTTIRPDGSQQFNPFYVTYANVQPGTPPELPADPKQGRAWVELHNENLLSVIRALVRDDASEMTKFARAEQATAGDDLFSKVAYRTKVAAFLAGGR
jgi:hypothetical protein